MPHSPNLHLIIENAKRLHTATKCNCPFTPCCVAHFSRSVMVTLKSNNWKNGILGTPLWVCVQSGTW